MKIAAKVLGALTLGMIIACTVLIFVGASQIFDALQITGDGSGDAFDAIAGGVSAIFGILGYLGYILLNAFGACFALYVVSFIIAYVRLYLDKSSISFNKYSAVTAGFLLFFVTVIFACNPSGMWKSFAFIAAATILMIVYAAVAIAAQKKAFSDEENIGQGDGGRYDEPPQFNFDVDMLHK